MDVGTNGGFWPCRAVIAMMIGGPETTGHKLRKPNQCLSMAVPMSVSQLEVIAWRSKSILMTI
jgi:6-phosphogluconate dehydrogenase (decarboxylating)